MRAKKYGTPQFMRNRVTSRRLFYNQKKGLSLVECREWCNGFFDKWWEIYRIGIDDVAFAIKKTLVARTPRYAEAWNFVCDENFRIKGGDYVCG